MQVKGGGLAKQAWRQISRVRRLSEGCRQAYGENHLSLRYAARQTNQQATNNLTGLGLSSKCFKDIEKLCFFFFCSFKRKYLEHIEEQTVDLCLNMFQMSCLPLLLVLYFNLMNEETPVPVIQLSFNHISLID